MKLSKPEASAKSYTVFELQLVTKPKDESDCKN